MLLLTSYQTLWSKDAANLLMINLFKSKTTYCDSDYSRSYHLTKRSYLEDYKPEHMFTVRTLTSLTVRALVLPLALQLNNYNQFITEQENKEYDEDDDEEDDDNVPEFDFTAAGEKIKNDFFPQFKRVVITDILRTMFEYLAVRNFSAKIADKLSKDVGKSLKRKLMNNPRLRASYKLFYTSLWGRSFTNLSAFIYEEGNTTWAYYYNVWYGKEGKEKKEDKDKEKEKEKEKDNLGTVTVTPSLTIVQQPRFKTILINAIASTVGWVCFSCGYAIGSAFDNKYSFFWLSTIFGSAFELGGYNACLFLLYTSL